MAFHFKELENALNVPEITTRSSDKTQKRRIEMLESLSYFINGNHFLNYSIKLANEFDNIVRDIISLMFEVGFDSLRLKELQPETQLRNILSRYDIIFSDLHEDAKALLYAGNILILVCFNHQNERFVKTSNFLSFFSDSFSLSSSYPLTS